jgi:hypothetical protein
MRGAKDDAFHRPESSLKLEKAPRRFRPVSPPKRPIHSSRAQRDDFPC